MPELPEVETVRRGLALYLPGLRIVSAVVRERRLRYAVTPGLSNKIKGQRVKQLDRRAKYLLMKLEHGCLIYHLGMSGSLRLVSAQQAADAHEHLDICFSNQQVLRFRDPRKFGMVLWTADNPLKHKRLRALGVEPLGDEFDGEYLYRASRPRTVAIKNFLMDSHVVVGVGNIYASEALFEAGIRPTRSAGRVSKARYQRLAAAVRTVLSKALAQGGTTLQDFVSEQGQPGYFQQSLKVYQRDGKACLVCGSIIRRHKIGQRSSFYCPNCQR